MKIHSNIPKLQQGGAALPFVSWTPVPDTPYSAAVASGIKSRRCYSKGNDRGIKTKGTPVRYVCIYRINNVTI